MNDLPVMLRQIFHADRTVINSFNDTAAATLAYVHRVLEDRALVAHRRITGVGFERGYAFRLMLARRVPQMAIAEQRYRRAAENAGLFLHAAYSHN
ncbi:hypothetical protein F3I27_20545 [Pantoea sp. Bo_2]|uniref:Uncharacterized protein n=1 Tax=Candidatus Pantoea gossypiicola TaxID=2608008 RepID=A0AB34CCL0_9GAMM|nr:MULTISPECIES: hypothetical protein [Pantoea]KAA5920946.1 hypothetical protein F3I59_23295 [Pantoea sp. VH_8]KAA5928481.1 hypothetical protein F3I58_22140 [Pantoea sp. VH_4]KAA5936410.1 hypothetical protein F3I57_22840 [Pantoea sp. VH_3]KAA5948122.1 hypothetical protein F3I56_20755 [Pantoea sp. VH_25]KAA5977826.1 hypothetical protein F3I49_23280 [Pantoea sp. M_4]